MRVAYLADLNSYARSLIRLKALRERGHQVWPLATVPQGSSVLGYTRLPLWERVLRKLRVYLDSTGASRALLALARDSRLDLIWVDKGVTISKTTLARAKAASGALAVSFSEDDMALTHSNSPRWIAALPEYDLVVTTKVANIEHKDLEGLGARRVFYVNQSYDPAQHFPAPMSPEEHEAFGADISFVGSYEKERAGSLLSMAQAGLPVRIWGNGWAGKLSHPNLVIEGRAALNTDKALDYSKVLTASKISLGFLRRLSRDQHTSRSLEIPACGSMLLAERTPVHQALFEEGVEAEFFDSDEELIAKARYYLENEEKRLKIAQAGHERCIRDYSSARQMSLILQALGMG